MKRQRGRRGEDRQTEKWMREAKQVEGDEKEQAEGEGEKAGWWYASDC